MAAKKAVKKTVSKTKSKSASAKAAPAKAAAIVQVPTALPANVGGAATSLAAKAGLLKVVDAEALTVANSLLVDLKNAEKQVTSIKDSMVKPLKVHTKNLEAMFKPIIVKLDTAIDSLKGKVITYHNEQNAAAEKKRLALEAAAQEAQGNGDEEKALALQTEAVQVENVTKTSAVETGGSVGVVMRDTFEVEDLGLVPHEYFTLDEKKIRAAMKAGVTEIPGVRFFKTAGLAVSTGAAGMPQGDVVDGVMEMN